jgi:hypothetical protein
MRFIHWYLIGYFILLAGAGLSLLQAGILARVSPLWVFLAIVVSVGLGVVVAVTARKPSTT